MLSMQWGILLMLGALACGRTGLDGDGPPGAASSDAAVGSCTRGFSPPRTFASDPFFDDAIATPLDVVVALELPTSPQWDVGTMHLAFDGTVSQARHNLAFAHHGGGAIDPSPMALALGPSGVVGFIGGGSCTAYLEATSSPPGGTASSSGCFAPLGTADGFTALAETGVSNLDTGFTLGIFDPLGKLVTLTPPLFSARNGSRVARARSSDDSFLVAWGPSDFSGLDAQHELMVQHFGSHGEPAGIATVVLSDPAFKWLAGQVAIATSPAGSVAVWSSGNSLDTASSGVWVRALDQDGVPVGAASRVLDDSAMVAATSLPSGALVVASSGNRIWAFIVSPDGSLHGEVVTVDAAADVGSLHVVPTPAGALVVFRAGAALWAAPLCVP